MAAFDLPGALRRVRRTADVSQRELAAACRVSQSSIAQAESGRRDLPVGVLARATELAGLRLALLDETGAEVAAMDGDAVRDGARRRFPAHLDTRHGDDRWWHGEERYSRVEPWYTFDRCRDTRDVRRGRLGVPDEHQLPQPGDSPAARRARRRAEARRHRVDEARRRREAGELAPVPEWTCTCAPSCDYDEERNPDLRHDAACACLCDVS